MARYTGGCLCGALRYEATEKPAYEGHCYCADCRKASGSGFIPFMSFPRSAVKFSGKILKHRSKAASGRVAVRNSCAVCGGLVFGGRGVNLFFDLRGLVGRTDDFPSEGRHFYPQSTTMGCHSARADHLRRAAAITVSKLS